MVLGGSHVFIQTPPRCGVLSCQKNNQPFQRKLQKQWALVIPCRIFKASSKRVTSVRHTHCGYRETSSVHPRHATKGRFSDDNLLIRSIPHFFVSFFSPSPFFSMKRYISRIILIQYHSFSVVHKGSHIIFIQYRPLSVIHNGSRKYFNIYDTQRSFV